MSVVRTSDEWLSSSRWMAAVHPLTALLLFRPVLTQQPSLSSLLMPACYMSQRACQQLCESRPPVRRNGAGSRGNRPLKLRPCESHTSTWRPYRAENAAVVSQDLQPQMMDCGLCWPGGARGGLEVQPNSKDQLWAAKLRTVRVASARRCWSFALRSLGGVW